MNHASDNSLTAIFFIGLLSMILASCASTPKEEKEPAHPVKEPIVAATTPPLPQNPTAGWRRLKDDTNLPTKEQLADGADSSIGQSQPGAQENNQPSTIIKPPPAEPDDQLAPSE